MTGGLTGALAAALWGLAGAASIGTSDAAARWTTPRASLGALFVTVMGVSTCALAGWLALTDGWPRWDAYAWIASALSGGLNLVALGFLYTALARGPVSVASPAASSFVALLVLLNALAGAPISAAQALAAPLLLLGVIMLARPDRSDAGRYDAAHLRGTALLGLACAGSVSLRMFLAQEAAVGLDPLPALFLNRVFATLAALIWIAAELSRRRLRFPAPSVLPAVLMQAVLETVALFAFLTGSAGEGRVAATIGFAAFPAFTAIAAWVAYRDPIGWRRAGWMALVITAAALASIG
jgi:drug/metabolite transporter (DMT)-like permease